jgi:hypothetical protein
MPTALDVVWCRFPLEEFPDIPSPDPHPALVRAVDLYDQHTHARIELTFGTSKKIYEGNLDLVISNVEEMNEAGLFQATRFKLDKTRWLPWAEEFFSPREGEQTCIIGRLGAGSLAQLEVLKVLRRQVRSRKPHKSRG